MEAAHKLKDLRKETKLLVPIQNKNLLHFFNVFEPSCAGTKLKLKSHVAMGVSQLPNSAISDQIASRFTDFRLDLILSFSLNNNLVICLQKTFF